MKALVSAIYKLYVLRLVIQLCLTLCDPMNCSLPGSSVHGILQTRILEWVVMPFSRGSSQPRDRTQVSRIVGGFFTIWATREAYELYGPVLKKYEENRIIDDSDFLKD